MVPKPGVLLVSAVVRALARSASAHAIGLVRLPPSMLRRGTDHRLRQVVGKIPLVEPPLNFTLATVQATGMHSKSFFDDQDCGCELPISTPEIAEGLRFLARFAKIFCGDVRGSGLADRID